MLDWKYASYCKGFSITYKPLCCILHNLTKFKWEIPVAEGQWDLVKSRMHACHQKFNQMTEIHKGTPFRACAIIRTSGRKATEVDGLITNLETSTIFTPTTARPIIRSQKSYTSWMF
ncbi:hypothetical protein DAPPUDRAFT_325235 [Daphnia pulex]|uniref:Uncharacterized protein n=1 Tax=Daphnia pulex TaxID=6669 RepID=E9H439_DAPPU|nr:hypothetical protein DAPPUDRAFT_325235 [Daphnia pulex]|eukprot:EFX73500.1 hypothetical protein DAPPUDRAFT_325235 [Daphnia pulex]